MSPGTEICATPRRAGFCAARPYRKCVVCRILNLDFGSARRAFLAESVRPVPENWMSPSTDLSQCRCYHLRSTLRLHDFSVRMPFLVGRQPPHHMADRGTDVALGPRGDD